MIMEQVAMKLCSNHQFWQSSWIFTGKMISKLKNDFRNEFLMSTLPEKVVLHMILSLIVKKLGCRECSGWPFWILAYFSDCSRIRPRYPPCMFYRGPMDMESIEKKTISADAGSSPKINFGCQTIYENYINLNCTVVLRACHHF